ncbi:MAG: molybdenum ABC transporter ATP-binding protein [Hyphomicrobiales bacterium]|nr:molybdenum ABC transporter ATP-binding protein [Hyphomicrobiales bacterium]
MMDDEQLICAALKGRLGAFGLDVRFRTPMRGVTGVFGPSGCGKTTILRCLAGLQRIPGQLSIGGEVWQDDTEGVFRAPHRREVGYVFQEPSLFPHLSVRDNLLYGARRAASRGVTQQIREDEIVALLGIGDLLTRGPQVLSGGERQRVAVGRALLSQPRLLLMDEPLSALDRNAKQEILPYFEALHAHLSIPVIYVSHDFGELQRLADTLILIDDGRVTASGSLEALQANPDLPLLHAPDAAVTIDGEITALDSSYALTTVAIAGGRLVLPGILGEAGERRRVQIKASGVSLSLSPPASTTVLNNLPFRVVSITPHHKDPSQVSIIGAVGEDGRGARIIARITRKSQETLGLAPGVSAFAQIETTSLAASPIAQTD